MVHAEGLTKRFGEKVAVNALDLAIPAGEVFAFLGPNGAGKTTTIKMMTGLIRPSAGRIRIGGHDIQREHVQAKALMGHIPDHPYLYEKLSARDFIHFVGDLHGIPRDEQERHLEEHFALFELTESTDHLIENFSHGMRQKLVFTAALLHGPRLLVVDEPMVGLDPKSARIIKRLMRQKAEGGASVFLSTHQLAVAEEVADRIGIIDRGHLIFLGTLDELRRRSHDAGTLEDLFLELTGAPPVEEEPRA
ncbi:ABC transporter ATP-binding protein [Candidatus Sumerlaeota bacterium]|nr:ABC transporter ATP-binding protein [Candidatus Sumerlaeota bacterium]